MTEAPSAWRIEQALSAWQSARSRLLADNPDADVDAVLGAETDDVSTILERLLTAQQWAAAQAKAAATLIEDMDTRRHRYTNRDKAIRGTLFAMMDALGETKFEAAHGTISIRTGQPAVIITDEDALADRFVTVKRVPNKTEIDTALKDGEVVDGAMLTNSLPTLSIRIK